MNAPTVSFAEVKRQVGIEALLARYSLFEGLTLRGRNLTGPCPFCGADSKRAFRASPEKNVWYCFACKRGGNVLDFVAKREGTTIRQAALALDEWFALGLAAPGDPKAVTPTAPPASPASQGEGSTEVHENVLLTFALKTLDTLHPSLAAIGLAEAVIRDFGLGFCGRGLLKGRIAIPVHNEGGGLVAYAGLATDPGSGDRYLFPPNFRPALEVFNLHRLRREERGSGTVYLAPDILGVLRLAGAGFPLLLGLFDGMLSEMQEAALLGAVPEGARMVLVGSGFEASIFGRLARTFAVRNLASPPASDTAARPGETP